MLSYASVFIAVGLLLLTSVQASQASNRFGIPALLLFLAIGMVAGSEGIGGIAFNDPQVMKLIGDITLTAILFAGGLETRWRQIRPVLGQGLLLATVGVVLTTVLLGSFAWFVLGSFSNFNLGPVGLTWAESLLLGAMVSSTDAAAVFSILRSSQLRLKGNLQPLLELESGSNDPLAVLLVTTLVQVVAQADQVTVGRLGASLLWQIVGGVLLGLAAGWVVPRALKRWHLPSAGLYPVAMIAFVALLFGVTEQAGGSAMLAVYIAGVAIGNQPFPYRETVLSFHEGLAWIAQIALFLMLGLLVFPSQLPSIALVAIALSFWLMLVARPLSVFLCLGTTPIPWREKLFVSWTGLRGAVPIVLATFPAIAGIPGSEQVFNVVFMIVALSVLIQGRSLPWAAGRLHATERESTSR